MATVLVPLAQGCEELEAVTIIDLLRRAEIEVITAGLEPGPVKASRGTVIVPDKSLDDVMQDSFAMVVLPGGLPGADYLDKDPRIHQILATTHQQQGLIGAICAAPKVLANAGFLQNRVATAYPGVLLPEQHADINITTAAVEVDGNIITSKGPGTAIEFALTLIQQLCGVDKRQQVERQLQRA